MKTFAVLALSLSLTLLSLPGLCAAQAFKGKNVPDDKSRLKAQRLWEQAIAAKGGRERLYAVSNFVVSSKSSFGLSPRPDVMAGVKEENLYVLPGKWWSFSDYRPGKMGYSIDVLDFERSTWWHTSPGKKVPLSPRPEVRQDVFNNFKERFRQAQFIYLMETQWVKPTIVGARTEREGLRKMDVVETLIDGVRVDFYLDRQTHLPRKIATDFPGVRTGGKMDYTCRLDDYVEINGLRMPQKVDCLDKNNRTAYQFNVPYNAAIFEHPPTPDMSAEAWKISAR
ncbi:MAG TPA: hypothetical protein VGB17_11365 [Pyrinomonadaceae bacterium]|jgi:hypothetical protein